MNAMKTVSIDAHRPFPTAKFILVLVTVASLGANASEALQPSDVTIPRQVTLKSLADYPPLFAEKSATLDPLALARQCWKGYLTTQPEPWGMLPDGSPTLRFHFDNRALPWPVLKHHSVDGFDNNNRNLGAHALLHEMLGKEKDDDPAEKGEIGYLLSITDPALGLPYSPDTQPRQCAVGHGELVQNVIMLYKQTNAPFLRDWAERMLRTLRRYAATKERPGVGLVAAYNQGMITIGEPPAMETKDPTMGGWQHLAVGWNLGAFSRWYELTHERETLDFAVALANRLCNSEDPSGNDGSLRPDGSFGGNAQESSASWHMHGHTHSLPRLVHLGCQLVQAQQQDVGVRMILQAAATFDWLYDPARNPDAGSMTGWLPEWLIQATGWKRKSDCEGCTMGDVVQTAVALGAASRLDPRLAELDQFHDRAEQIFTGQLLEQTFGLRPEYLTVMKDCLRKRVEKDMPTSTLEAKTQEMEHRYETGVNTAKRMIGQQLGLCGFPDWVNQQASDLDPDLPGIHMQGCCSDATIRAAHAVWSETVTGDEQEARVNLAFNRLSPLLDVTSCLPHRGELDIRVKSARRVLVRVPAWAPREQVKAYIDRQPVPVAWEGSYVIFSKVTEAQLLTVTYPLAVQEVRETLQGVDYVERWRGNSIVDISPPGKWIPLFQRPELEKDQVPN